MSVQEIIAEIPKLSVNEQLVLIETLSHNLRNTYNQTQRKSIPASKLRGIIKTNQPPPTDEEIQQDYLSYLEEKYS